METGDPGDHVRDLQRDHLLLENRGGIVSNVDVKALIEERQELQDVLEELIDLLEQGDAFDEDEPYYSIGKMYGTDFAPVYQRAKEVLAPRIGKKKMRVALVAIRTWAKNRGHVDIESLVNRTLGKEQE